MRTINVMARDNSVPQPTPHFKFLALQVRLGKITIEKVLKNTEPT